MENIKNKFRKLLSSKNDDVLIEDLKLEILSANDLEDILLWIVDTYEFASDDSLESKDGLFILKFLRDKRFDTILHKMLKEIKI